MKAEEGPVDEKSEEQGVARPSGPDAPVRPSHTPPVGAANGHRPAAVTDDQATVLAVSAEQTPMPHTSGERAMSVSRPEAHGPESDQQRPAEPPVQPEIVSPAQPRYAGPGPVPPIHRVDHDAATYQDLPPQPNAWHAAGMARPYAPPPQMPPRHQPMPSHVPWHVSDSWGPTTFTITATTAAGAAYLFWWISGVIVYFNERHNRYVRFHAMQSILLTGALTVCGVLAYILSALCFDVASASHQPIFSTIGTGIAILLVPAIVGVWLFVMMSAWTGHYLIAPVIGRYAERYAAPPIESTTPPRF